MYNQTIALEIDYTIIGCALSTYRTQSVQSGLLGLFGDWNMDLGFTIENRKSHNTIKISSYSTVIVIHIQYAN